MLKVFNFCCWQLRIAGMIEWERHRLWIKVNGYGISIRDHRIDKPLFSERNGYRKTYHIGPWCFESLRPEVIKPVCL